MEHNANVFDIWVVHLTKSEPKYLLLHTSKEKADKWFNGGQFWQIPSGIQVADMSGFGLKDILAGTLQLYGLLPMALFDADYVYSSYSRRRGLIETIPVFAAIVEEGSEPTLTWQHDQFGWYTAAECAEKLQHRGYQESLVALRKHITEAPTQRRELRLA